MSDGWGNRGGARVSAGFTIIELMIAVVLLGIVMAMAAPEFNRMNANARIGGYTMQLQEFFGAARSLAVTSQRQVDVVRTATAWEIRQTIGGVEIVRQSFAYEGDDNIAETRSPAGVTTYRYTPTGFFLRTDTVTPTSVDLALSLCVSNVTGEQGKTVDVRRTGQTRHFKSTVACS